MDRLKHLKDYKYRGTDNSIASRFILTPIHSRLLCLVPLWMAPNVLTLLGFLCALIGATLTIVTDCTLAVQKHPTVFLINGLLILAYQALDSLDGKQARRLGMSSPLGQLFDHGCDMFVSVFVCIMLSSALSLGTGFGFLLTVVSFLTTYFVCCVEEYYLDEFYLGYVNGPSEGILAAVAVHIFSFMYGPSFFAKVLQHKVHKVPLVVLLNCTLIAATFLCSTFSILRNRLHSTKRDVVSTILNGYLILISTVLNAFHDYFQPTANFYFLVATCTFIMAKLTLNILYAHLRKARVEETDIGYRMYVFSAPLLQVVPVNRGLFVLVFGLAVYLYVDRAVFVVHEICDYLKIECFRVKHKKSE